jgi:alpha-ketoglutarate-dependent taurine dioxygenase
VIRFDKLPGFGVEARGVDLARPLPDADFAELERAFYANHVLALRDQGIDAAQFVAFARRLGPPQPHVIDQFHHPDDPNILILSNVRNKDGKPTGLQDAGSYFHTDYSYLQVPARATTLYSRVVPKRGGDTLFADQGPPTTTYRRRRRTGSSRCSRSTTTATATTSTRRAAPSPRCSPTRRKRRCR